MRFGGERHRARVVVDASGFMGRAVRALRADLDALSRLPKGTPIALQRPVQIGSLQHNRYPVLQGLQAGERVIVSGAVGLRHGSPIRLSRGGARPGAGPAPVAPGAS